MHIRLTRDDFCKKIPLTCDHGLRPLLRHSARGLVFLLGSCLFSWQLPHINGPLIKSENISPLIKSEWDQGWNRWLVSLIIRWVEQASFLVTHSNSFLPKDGRHMATIPNSDIYLPHRRSESSWIVRSGSYEVSFCGVCLLYRSKW